MKNGHRYSRIHPISVVDDFYVRENASVLTNSSARKFFMDLAVNSVAKWQKTAKEMKYR